MTTAAPSYAEALAQADLLFLAAQSLGAPDASGSWHWRSNGPQLEAMVDRAGLDPRGTLLDALRQYELAIEAIDQADWTMERTRLFEGAVQCPINETAYVRRDKGWILADICGFHHAFGFHVSEASSEKADHLICEIEFAAMLLIMLAQAGEQGDDEAVEITLSALHSFLEEHLGEWILLFVDRLDNATSLPLYQMVAELLRELWSTMAARYSVIVREATECPPIEPNDTDQTPYECGMAPVETLVPLTTSGGVK